MSVKSIDIEELGSTIQGSLLRVEVQIANLTDAVKELVAIMKDEVI
tara:strand:+ start:93 stop:230 length:138 start_codon:yes stop_codon:yes gene_type:complete